MRILHIAQLEEFVSGRTILEELLNADTERVRIIREAEGIYMRLHYFIFHFY